MTGGDFAGKLTAWRFATTGIAIPGQGVVPADGAQLVEFLRQVRALVVVVGDADALHQAPDSRPDHGAALSLQLPW
jgi:hypothetical protein